MRTVSVNVMLQQLEGLIDTNDLSDWETDFVLNVLEQFHDSGQKTSSLTERQVEKVEQIWQKNFA